MTSLTERLEEVMRAQGWQHADLVRVSGQSSSVVSQWLGKGSKEIKSIGSLDAALRIEAASGFSALWVAKEQGPKRSTPALQATALKAEEPAAAYPAGLEVLEQLGRLLSLVPPENRGALATNLHGWAMDGGAPHWQAAIASLLTKQRQRA